MVHGRRDDDPSEARGRRVPNLEYGSSTPHWLPPTPNFTSARYQKYSPLGIPGSRDVLSHHGTLLGTVKPQMYLLPIATCREAPSGPYLRNREKAIGILRIAEPKLRYLLLKRVE